MPENLLENVYERVGPFGVGPKNPKVGKSPRGLDAGGARPHFERL